MRAGDNIGEALDRFHDRKLNKHLDATAEPEHKNCPKCKGTGKVSIWIDKDFSISEKQEQICKRCNGTGKMNTNGEEDGRGNVGI